MPLSDLASALATATGPSRELDERLATEVFGQPLPGQRFSKLDGKVHEFVPRRPAYTSDLNAIVAGIKARWTLVWRITSDEATSAAELNAVAVRRVIAAEAATPALALSLAAARLAEREAGE